MVCCMKVRRKEAKVVNCLQFPQHDIHYQNGKLMSENKRTANKWSMLLHKNSTETDAGNCMVSSISITLTKIPSAFVAEQTGRRA